MASCTLPRGVLKRGLNDVLEQHVGSFGTYQKIAIFLISLPTVVTGMTLLDVMYLTASPHFWYVYNGEQLNRTIIQTKMDECKLENGTSIDELGDGYWQYDETEFRTSIVSRGLDRINDKVVGLVGTIFGTLFCGVLADTFGRKRMLWSLTLIATTCRVISVFILNYIAVATVYFILGFYSMAGLFISYTLGVELVGRSARPIVATVCSVAHVSGMALITCVTYIATNPTDIELFAAVCTSTQLVVLWFIPRSPFWLLSSNKPEEARTVLSYMAKKNGNKPIDDDLMILPDEDIKTYGSDDGYTMYHVMLLVSRTIFLLVICSFLATMYYGIQLQLDHVPGNTYLNALLMGISEIPGYIAMAFATKSRLGRTGTLFISLIVAGVSMSLTGIDSGEVVSGLYIVAFVSSSLGVAVVYLIAVEMYPTLLRNSLFGFTGSVGRIAAIATTSSNLFGQGSGEVIGAVFGTGTCLALISLLGLPETLNKPLPQTLRSAMEMKSVFSVMHDKLCYRDKETQLLLPRNEGDSPETTDKNKP